MRVRESPRRRNHELELRTSHIFVLITAPIKAHLSDPLIYAAPLGGSRGRSAGTSSAVPTDLHLALAALAASASLRLARV